MGCTRGMFDAGAHAENVAPIDPWMGYQFNVTDQV
jgi:hypothetical protein